MSTGRTLALERARILKGALLLHGVPEVSIELQEGRPTNGDPWNACNPIGETSHHIASRPTPAYPTPGLSLVKNGRSDLPGPLANGTAGVDLVYRILTMGLANHPGFGGPLTLYGPAGAFSIPKDVGRPYLWGTEYEGGYDDEVWDATYTNQRKDVSMTFREFMGRCNAGLTYGIWLINGKGHQPVLGDDYSGYHTEHKTWAPGRKPDRLNYSTESGRSEAAIYYQPQEDDMPTPEDLWSHPISVAGEDKEIPAHRMLSQAHARSGAARQEASAALAQAEKNRKAIALLARKISGIPQDVVEEISETLGSEQPRSEYTED